MLFEELQRRTNHMATYTEFEIVNAAYMFSLDTNRPMDHDDAARMWDGLYGAEHRRRNRERQALIRQMLATAEDDMSDRPENVRQAIFNAEKGIRESRNGNPWSKNFTDEMGINWVAEQIGTTPNRCYGIYALHVLTPKGRQEVGYRYY